MIKMFAVALVVLAICSAGAFAAYNVGKYFDEKIIKKEVNSFDECIRAGNSAIADNPIRCISSNGTVYFSNGTIAQ